MKAFVFAAGMGSRLRPLTDSIPKALVSIGGTPLLKIVMDKLKKHNADEFVVNVHHHAELMKSYIRANCMNTCISDESRLLLDTGGGIRNARPLLEGCGHFIAHNVDILSNADLTDFSMKWRPDALAMLLVSDRPTSRHLLFDDSMKLVGWENALTGEIRSPYTGSIPDNWNRLAFSGIHMISDRIFDLMENMGEVFSIVDFYLKVCKDQPIYGVKATGLRILDAGKPENLRQAQTCFEKGDRFWE